MNTVKKIALMAVFAISAGSSASAETTWKDRAWIGAKAGAVVLGAAAIPAAQVAISKIKNNAKRSGNSANKHVLAALRGAQVLGGLVAAVVAGNEGRKYFFPEQKPAAGGPSVIPTEDSQS